MGEVGGGGGGEEGEATQYVIVYPAFGISCSVLHTFGISRLRFVYPLFGISCIVSSVFGIFREHPVLRV